jgi:ribonuclease HI
VLKERELSGGEAADHQQPDGADGRDRGARGAGAALEITVVTDSAYVKNGITEWLDRGLEAERLAHRGPEAREERGPLAAARRGARAPPGRLGWIKGHAGHPENERADELARAGMKPFKPKRARMTLVVLLDYAAVFVFALTGALVASRAQLDIVGFVFLACLTATGAARCAT